uniref:Serine--tRNA ligase n=1 Tax=Lygus hesperus TaxID=30085 RepID=A0A0A9Y672_LYGHE
MKTVIWICMMLLPYSSPGALDWSKMRPVFRELPNFFTGELKDKIVKITTEDLKLKGLARQHLIHDLFSPDEIEDIKNNLRLWADYARAELGSGGSPSQKELMKRLDKAFADKKSDMFRR